jgi:hypothetical protein
MKRRYSWPLRTLIGLIVLLITPHIALPSRKPVNFYE